MKYLIGLIVLLLILAGCARVNNPDSQIPEPYYEDVPRKYGVENLRSFLDGKEWVRDYKAHEFDCTEMSALLECILENEGFRTIIVGGKHEGYSHCWLEVEVNPELYRIQQHPIPDFVIVESTTLEVIDKNNPERKKYSRPIYYYETIYEAVKVSSTAFDWWNKEE